LDTSDRFRSAMVVGVICVCCWGCSSDGGSSDGVNQTTDTTPEVMYGQQSMFEEPDPCTKFGFVFETVEVCDETTCPALECDCDLDGLLNPCRETVGCLKEWDCDVVCPAITDAFFCIGRATSAEKNLCAQDSDCEQGSCAPILNVQACVQELPCREDGHCGEGAQCVRGFGTPVCTFGEVGEICVDAEDCATGFCGFEECTTGSAGESCRDDLDCASGDCFYEEGQSRTTPGVCN